MPIHCSGTRGSNKLDWATDEPVWQVLGEIGEKLGLRWGGRWQQKDMGHFELTQQKIQPGEPDILHHA